MGSPDVTGTLAGATVGLQQEGLARDQLRGVTVTQEPALDRGLEELSQFFVGDKTMLDSLHCVAELAVHSIESVDYASVTMVIDGAISTGVFTHADAPEIEQVQYETGEGPSLDAFHTGEIARITSTPDPGRWPAFRKACVHHGMMSIVSIPMVIDGIPHGALNLYSRDHDAFEAAEIRTGRSLAVQAGVVIAYARAYWNAKQLSEHLEAALVHRAEIEQAKGVIIATTGASADEAFEILVKQSQHENRKLREVALDLVNSKIGRR